MGFVALRLMLLLRVSGSELVGFGTGWVVVK